MASCYISGCNVSSAKTSFHRLPSTDKDLIKKWLSFIYKDGEVPPLLPSKLRVCSAHFTDDCVSNLVKVTMGFAQKRILKPDAVPTLYPDTAVNGTSSEALLNSAVVDRSSDVGVQCHIKHFLNTVGTQLSEGTLGKSIRSKGVQVKPSTKTREVAMDSAIGDLSSTTAVRDGPPPMKRACLDFPPSEDTEEDSQNTTDSSDRPGGSSLANSSITYTNAEPVYNPKDTTKYIVYEDCLLSLFQHCPICTCNCVVKKTVRGTFLSILQKCPSCGYHRQWNSQPIIGSTPAGDLQLSAAISFTGSSFAQVDKVLTALKVKSIAKTTYHKHARTYLDPCIYSTWKTVQTGLLQTMRSKDSVILGGNSPGHNAKYDSYTVSDIESGNVIDVQLVQSNEVSHSNRVEKEGLVRSLNFLESSGVKIDTLITDRHLQVDKYLGEEKPEVTHYYDVRHVAKDVSQKVEQLGKEKDCEVIQKWQQSIVNHLYWSTHQSPSGEDTVAKWSSLVNHIHNVHNHTSALFPKCLHPRRKRHWLKSGTKPSIKLQEIIQNKCLLKDVAKLSPLHQTSDIEGFHSLTLRFAPKNQMLTFRGMLCRLYLAAMHHNENKRQRQLQNHDKCIYRIWYPKYKKGRYIPTKKQPTLNYVRNLMDVLFEEVLTDPGRFTAKLNELPIPPSP